MGREQSLWRTRRRPAPDPKPTACRRQRGAGFRSYTLWQAADMLRSFGFRQYKLRCSTTMTPVIVSTSRSSTASWRMAGASSLRTKASSRFSRSPRHHRSRHGWCHARTARRSSMPPTTNSLISRRFFGMCSPACAGCWTTPTTTTSSTARHQAMKAGRTSSGTCRSCRGSRRRQDSSSDPASPSTRRHRR